MNGEEAERRSSVRARGHGVGKGGTSYELPYLGKFSWENSVAHPNAGDRTLVVGLDDSTPGQVYLYVGDKQTQGTPVEKAGLQDGRLYGIKVDGFPDEIAAIANASFSLEDVSAAALGSEADLQSASEALDVTQFARPEDGHWDTQNPNAFYWVTTGGLGQTARLYRFTFDSISAPTGGTIELVVDAASLTGTDGLPARSFDNMVVDTDGSVIIQEDPGNTSYIAKTWKIDPVTKQAAQIFESDRDRFLSGAPDFLTQDEENSGVIEVTDIVKSANWYEPGRRYYLGNNQAHYNITSDPELVQGGQVYLMASPKVAHPGKKKDK